MTESTARESTTHKIEQRRFLRGRQTLTLEGNMLRIEYRRGLSLNEYRFDLRGFLPDPARVKRVPLARIVASCLLTVLGTILVLAGADGKVYNVPSAMLAGIVFLIFAALAWSTVVKQTYDVVIFQGPSGQFVLWPDHHDKQELKEFLTALSTRIHEAQHHGEDVLRQLRRAEIIDDWGYEQAIDLLQQNGEHLENP